MADNWYYVQKGNRQGPVGLEVITSLIANQELRPEDFVWKKGFDNWKKIKDVSELEVKPIVETVPEISFPAAPIAQEETFEFSFTGFDTEDRSIFVRIGHDRGEAPSDYGPFSLNQIKRLFRENRINGKTFIFTPGMKEWKVMGDIVDYQEFFQEQPPVIKDADRRLTMRKPFVAKLFVENNKKLYEGLCRDVSVGGMQVLMSNFKGQSGEKITVNVHPENSEYNFVATGVVVRVLEGNSGFSFRFQNISDEARRSIEKYVQEN